jgi:subtilisin family serine protease
VGGGAGQFVRRRSPSTASKAAVAILLLAATTGCLRHDGRAAGCGRRPLVAVIDGGIAPVGPLRTRVHDRIDIVPPSDAPLDPHGTAMASIIVRQRPGAQLLDVRALGPDGRGTADDLAAAIDAARRADADVLLVSLALPADPAVDAAIVAAADAGAIVVVAAGNEGVDLDLQPRWRELAAHERVLVVGADDHRGNPFPRSNRGRTVVEARADGEAVPALDTSGAPLAVDGTSPAAATIAARC